MKKLSLLLLLFVPSVSWAQDEAVIIFHPDSSDRPSLIFYRVPEIPVSRAPILELHRDAEGAWSMQESKSQPAVQNATDANDLPTQDRSRSQRRK